MGGACEGERGRGKVGGKSDHLQPAGNDSQVLWLELEDGRHGSRFKCAGNQCVVCDEISLDQTRRWMGRAE